MAILDNPQWALADRLRRARLLAGLEQSDLASLLGVARTSISNYETGRTEPPASVFVHWAQVTGSTIDWLAAGVPALLPPEAVAVRQLLDDAPPARLPAPHPTVTDGVLARVGALRRSS